jgi:hypothetical protein
MKHCPLYNGENLNFTGKYNPYWLIQNGGKRKSIRKRKSILKRKSIQKRKSIRKRKTMKNKI